MISVVMLAYGAEEWLVAAVDAVFASEGVQVELILVDNGTTTDAVDRAIAAHPKTTLVRPGRNLGFTGGVNLGVTHANGEKIALVNSDALVEPACLAELDRELDDSLVGVAGAVVLFADRPEIVNSAGNPIHVLGLCWSGGLGEPASAVPAISDQASVSGACLMMRRDVWDELKGFPEEYFAYMEDMELCWRAWQLGYRVRLVGAAQCQHHYEFSRSDLKMYLLERNRLLFVMTNYQAKTLLLMGLPLIGFDVAMLIVATSQGWARQKVRGWTWILRNLSWVRRRRAFVQRTRRLGDRELAGLMTDTFDSEQMPLPPAAEPLQSLLRTWWAVWRKLV